MTTLVVPQAVFRWTDGVAPNWFAAVMGTGIVAVSAAGLPVHVPGLRQAAAGVWLLAAGLLAVLLVASVSQWRRATTHLADPIAMQFYGAPPMALMTVGGGALVLGGDDAVVLDAVLWTLGTIGGLITAVLIPYLMITRQLREPAFGGWLMPVVPPMVSAANGALLNRHLRSDTLDLVCVALFGASLIAAFLVIAHLYGRLFTQPPMPKALVPTLWIVLGPLGQSITAANLLLKDAVPFSLPVWGFAMLWLALAAAVTLKERPSFGLPWWSFTFPVGTLVTGTTGLAAATGSKALAAAAVGLFLLLVTLWATVSVLTLQHARCRHEAVAVDDLAAERHQ